MFTPVDNFADAEPFADDHRRAYGSLDGQFGVWCNNGDPVVRPMTSSQLNKAISCILKIKEIQESAQVAESNNPLLDAVYMDLGKLFVQEGCMPDFHALVKKFTQKQEGL